MPRLHKPNASAAAMVEPDPMNGSKIKPSFKGKAA